VSASSTRNIDFLDFAKGYAIGTIVLYHALQKLPLPPLIQQAIVFGGSGVHLFFLLSGFGLGLSRSSDTIFGFYRRRAVKIWIPYVLALSISLGAAFWFDLFPDRWEAWFAGVGLYQMFEEPFIQSFGGHFWFISAILQLYLVYPFLVRLKNQFEDPRRYFALCLIVSVGWWIVVWLAGKGDLRTWNSFFLQFVWEFALGQVLADLYKKNDPKGAFWNGTWWYYLPVGFFFSGLMVAMILKMGQVGRIFNDIPALIGYGAICIFIFRSGERFLPPLVAFFKWVGGISFPLYLIHVLVLDAFLLVLSNAGLHASLPWIFAYIGLALVAGAAFDRLSKTVLPKS
jgi:peptidoglycan/LPS O-acetylase OafA/YrhL